MDELNIAIDCLKGEISDVECDITKPTDFGKWPTAEEFKIIADLSAKRVNLLGRLNELEELREAVVSNAR